MKKVLRSKVFIACAAVVALFLMYVVLCFVIDDRTFYQNTTINGIDVSGLTVEEASEQIKGKFQDTYRTAQLNVDLSGEKYVIDVSDAINLNVNDAVEKKCLETHSFFKRGVNYVVALFSSCDYAIAPEVQSREKLHEAIAVSGLSDLQKENKDAYKIDGDKLVVVKGRGMFAVDEEALADEVEKRLLSQKFDEVIECPLVKGDVDIDKLHHQVYTEVKEPTLDPDNNYAVVEAVTGMDFDVAEAKKLLEAAKDGEEVRIPLKITEPKVSTEEYTRNLFKDELGSCTTVATGTSGRKSNVKLAADYCNGTILMPGEQFSYNNVVGERTSDRGFSPAPSYVGGESVDSIGGGICQTSSTLYDAVLYANLQVDERHPHPYVSGYIGAGLDATVAWGGYDFRFTNTLEYPVKIVTSFENDNVTCKVYGTNLDGIHVELSTEFLGYVDYDTEYKDDDSHEVGYEEVETSGIRGQIYQSYRTVYDKDGNVVSTTKESLSQYSTRTEVIIRGTKEPETEAPTTEEPTTEAPTTEAPTTEDPSGGDDPAVDIHDGVQSVSGKYAKKVFF